MPYIGTLVMKDNFDEWHTVFFNQLHIFFLTITT